MAGFSHRLMWAFLCFLPCHGLIPGSRPQSDPSYNPQKYPLEPQTAHSEGTDRHQLSDISDNGKELHHPRFPVSGTKGDEISRDLSADPFRVKGHDADRESFATEQELLLSTANQIMGADRGNHARNKREDHDSDFRLISDDVIDRFDDQQSLNHAEEYYFPYDLEDNPQPFDPYEVKDNSSPLLMGIAKHNNEEMPLFCRVDGLSADCSRMALRQVPTWLPHDIISLNLNDNKITSLGSSAFKLYPKLVNLTIDSNQLCYLSSQDFLGLSDLQLLSLWGNNLTMNNSTFPEEVFCPLKSLKTLKINRNNPYVFAYGLDYPDKALSCLKNLEKLAMDGLPRAKFGLGFSNLKKLKTLSLAGYMTGYCKMESLAHDTFVNLPSLTYLSLQDCRIKGKFLDARAFEPLTNLSVLSLTHNEDIDVDSLKKVFYGLRNSKLKFLYTQLIVNRYSVGICLSHEDIKDFPQHLTYFDAQENNLEAVDRSVIGMLSPTLQILDLSGNKFMFGTYLQDLPKMKNLITLRLNGGRYNYKLPGRYPYHLTRASAPENSTCNLYNFQEIPQLNETFEIALPPNLKYLEMNTAGLSYTLSKLHINENNKLRNLSIYGNRFPSLQGPIQGLNSLKYLDISNCEVQIISKYFFNTFSSLEELQLGSNKLGYFFAKSYSSKVFSSLTNLKILNISSNDIHELTHKILDDLVNLNELYLQNNPLYYFSVDVFYMRHLNLLDLRYTRVSYLSESARDAIDSILKNSSSKVTILMSGSPIICDCKNLDYIRWMTTSRAFSDGFDGYICFYPDTRTSHIQDSYEDTIRTLEGECTSHTLLFLLVASLTVLAFITIIVALMYRFRWKLRYLYYAAYLHYRNMDKKERDQFEFDVFICYAHEDHDFAVDKVTPELEKRGIKVFVHGRDFVAGDYIASNIVKAVCKSRRTLVVLTRHMINSYWCGYEIQMAKLESVHTGRRVLVFLLMEQIPKNDLGVDLLYNIQNNTYIPFPSSLPDATSIGRLWDKLAADIRG